MANNLSIQPQLPGDIYRVIFSYLPTRELPDLIFIEKRMMEVCQPLFDRALEGDLTGVSKEKFQFFKKVAERECQSLSLNCKPFNKIQFISYALQTFTNLKTLKLEKRKIKFEKFEIIQSVLQTSLTSLKALDCYARYTGPAIKSDRFFSYFPTTLQRLNLRNFFFDGSCLPTDFFERFSKSHLHLTSLHFQQCCRDSPQIFQAITALTDLQNVFLMIGTGKCESFSQYFEPLTKLQHLDIRFYNFFAMDTYNLFLPHLTYLSAPIALDQTWEFLKDCTELKTLEITGNISQNAPQISYDNYDILTFHLTQLQSLSFSAFNFSAAEVEGIGTCLTNLKAFGLSSKHGQQVIAQIAQSMTQLSELKFKIDLEENLEGYMQQIALLTNLKKLNLSYIYINAIEPPTAYLKYCTGLTRLNYLQCDYVSEEDLQLICTSFTKLEVLNLWLSSSFKSFNGIVSSALTHLTELAIFKNSRVKEDKFYRHVADSALSFFTQLTNLRELKTSVVPNSIESKPFLKERLTSLEL